MSNRKKRECKECKKKKFIKAFGRCDACYSKERYQKEKEVEYLERRFERDFMKPRGKKK